MNISGKNVHCSTFVEMKNDDLNIEYFRQKCSLFNVQLSFI